MKAAGILFPWEDRQERPSAGVCARCGMELYWYDEGGICLECRTEPEEEDG